MKSLDRIFKSVNEAKKAKINKGRHQINEFAPLAFGLGAGLRWLAGAIGRRLAARAAARAGAGAAGRAAAGHAGAAAGRAAAGRAGAGAAGRGAAGRGAAGAGESAGRAAGAGESAGAKALRYTDNALTLYGAGELAHKGYKHFNSREDDLDNSGSFSSEKPRTGPPGGGGGGSLPTPPMPKQPKPRYGSKPRDDSGSFDMQAESSHMKKKKKLIGKQHRLDRNKNGELDTVDFSMLRGESKEVIAILDLIKEAYQEELISEEAFLTIADPILRSLIEKKK